MLKELAYHPTPLGALVLRVRPEPVIGGADVYEVKLGDEFLMSSLFTAGEEALADLGLKDLEGPLNVVVGGLGLGYTAARALQNENVRSLTVVEYFEEVINWHRDGLVPAAASLISDNRCSFLKADFFELAMKGFEGLAAEGLLDAVLLDIDHTPDFLLDPKNAGFYSRKGLEALGAGLKPEGVFAMWSSEEADDDFVNLLARVFTTAEGCNVKFPNPYSNELAVNSIYIARGLAGT